ncbi:MAG: helix-turn-helix domain-containing protein [Patiriisocius sp.]|uniref:helix-turn-helix domain-containing protein n=1 Tax=Patiriisocius sp. TaxID=2822396 RepID=UPI003EF245AE
MKKIAVQSLPLFEVITDIAQALDVPYHENCGEYHLDLPPDLGTGYIKGINFDGGFGIIMYKCTFNEDVEFHFVVDDVHPLKFLYCLAGQLDHRFQDGKENNTIEQYQSSIVASKNRNGHILHFKANTNIEIGSLEIDREKFKVKMDCELKNLTPELKNLFRDKEASKQFYHNGYFSLQIADLFRNSESFDSNDFIRRIYLEGKAYQILTHQIIQFHDDIQDDGNRTLLRKSEVNQVNKATTIIEEEINDLDNIEQIAERVGLNINKLQQGFKYLHNSTVNEYIQNCRLDLAKKLLNKTDYNISEIVEKIGLSSKSYFSKVFKERYGIPPSDFRKKNHTR